MTGQAPGALSLNEEAAPIDPPLRVCAYEDRPGVMDSVILMGESLCRADTEISLHVTVPDAPASVRAWAERRPQVILSTTRPKGVSGWDVKPWLLLQELDAGSPEALWLDTDIIVTRPVSPIVKEFARDAMILAEEWGKPIIIPVSRLWGLPSARPIPVVNNCFVRVTATHRPLLEHWLQMLHDSRYRDAQRLPFERRPVYVLHDGWPLIALLECEEFAQVPFDYVRLGRHIAQCAGSSGYRPLDRFLDLFRGLPPLIHGLGRKPWDPRNDRGIQRFLFDLATDVSPYVLAARRIARDLDMTPPWIDTRTWPGALLRRLTAEHPGLAGLPLAIPHAFQTKIRQMMIQREKSGLKGYTAILL